MPEAVLLELVEVDLADELRANRIPVELLAARPPALAAGRALRRDEAGLYQRREQFLELPLDGAEMPEQCPTKSSSPLSL